MYEILKTEIYEKWFAHLKDKKAKALIDIRLARLKKGNFGDVEPVSAFTADVVLDVVVSVAAVVPDVLRPDESAGGVSAADWQLVRKKDLLGGLF